MLMAGDRLAEICALTADGLNLAGIRRVLELQAETRQLQAELTRLRELAGAHETSEARGRGQRARVAASRQPVALGAGSGVQPVLANEPGVQAGGQDSRPAARPSSRARKRSAAARVWPWSNSSLIWATKAS
jgi:DNA-binding transcriptional MerR regulator